MTYPTMEAATSTTRLRGVVSAFDEPSGLGEIESADHVYPFHCIDLTDGTRTVDPGASVEFTVMAKLGRYEATSIDTLDPVDDSASAVDITSSR